jgi:hypothetical protein
MEYTERGFAFTVSQIETDNPEVLVERRAEMKYLGTSPDVSSLDRKFIVPARVHIPIRRSVYKFFSGNNFSRGKPRTVNKLRKISAPFWRSRAKKAGCMDERPRKSFCRIQIFSDLCALHTLRSSFR